jgi:predicted acetyltransferase
VKIEVSPAELGEKAVLRNLLELYLYDFSEFDGGEVGPDGLYGHDTLDLYWTEAGRHPFLIRVDGQLAGFVLVNRHYYLPTQPDAHAIGEFFVMRKYRRSGVGEKVAVQIFQLFPGKWEVAQLADNLPAHLFWRKVIGRFTQDQYEEIFLDDNRWHGPVLTFESLPGSSS